MGEACSTHGRLENSIKILIGKPEGSRPYGRPGQKYEDNIKMDLKEIGWKVLGWIYLVLCRTNIMLL
jgi:hypothetical protein